MEKEMLYQNRREVKKESDGAEGKNHLRQMRKNITNGKMADTGE